jgi:hypothetical protein
VFYAKDDAYSTSESQIFQQALIARNLKSVAVIRTSVSDTDFQSQITETLSTLQLSPPPSATLAPPPCAELRRHHALSCAAASILPCSKAASRLRSVRSASPLKER